MTMQLDEVVETVRMTLDDHFDVRTATLGVDLQPCLGRSPARTLAAIQRLIRPRARALQKAADEMEARYGVPIVNRRVAISPASSLVAAHPDPAFAVDLGRTLDGVARSAGISFIGGFGALADRALSAADRIVLDVLPRVLAGTKRLCGFINCGTSNVGLNMDAVRGAADAVKETARRTKSAGGCTRFVVFVNAVPDNPFMAGAFHGPGMGDFALNIGISGPGAVRRVVSMNPSCSLQELSRIIKGAVFKITRAGELIGREMASRMGIPLGAVDLSLAPTPAVGDSVAEILEAMGIERVGAPGSTAALALLMDAVKKGGVMATGHVGGLSGTFIPVSEDAAMVAAVEEGALSLDKLEALSAVCSVGMDMFAVPGDTPVETVTALMADELAIGLINHKTTGVRIIPVPGAKAGDRVEWGGLLGGTLVQPVSRFSAKAFVDRGGLIPRPITSLRN
jgi:uncharacterized protein